MSGDQGTGEGTDTIERSVAAVIGDVVGSRHHADRRKLQDELIGALRVAGERTQPLQSFEMTIGDEFQGVFRTVEAATEATFLVQLRLVDVARIRFGIGIGTITLTSTRIPYGQDGPAWWRAREAIESVRAGEDAYGTPPHRATAIVGDGPGLAATRAYVLLRDHLLAGIDRVDAEILTGLLAGTTQAEISRRLNLDKGAVSRRVSRHGLSALSWSLGEFER